MVSKRKPAPGKRTATKLTMRACKAARHSGATFTAGDGREVPAREIVWDSEVRGLGLRLHPSGRKTWVLRYVRRGRTTLRPIADFGALPLDGPADPRHKSARKLAQRALANLAAGLDPFPDEGEGKTIADLEVDFMEDAGSRGVRASTLAKYREAFRLLREELGGSLIDELKASKVEAAFRRWRAERGEQAAAKALLILRMLLKLAVRLKLRDRHADDPTEALKMPKPAVRGYKFKPEQYRAIGEALDHEVSIRPVYADAAQAIRLLALTGCRRREITELTWAEVDLGAKLIRLPAVRSKTREAREIALSSAALVILAGLKPERAEGRVFPTGDGRHRMEFAVQPLWQKVRKRAGLPADARLHDLRHSFVTSGLSANYSEALVGKAVGHRSAASTRRYSHIDVDPVREVVERIGGDVAAAMGGAPEAEVQPIRGRK